MEFTRDEIEHYHEIGLMPDLVYYQLSDKPVWKKLDEQSQKVYEMYKTRKKTAQERQEEAQASREAEKKIEKEIEKQTEAAIDKAFSKLFKSFQ